MHPFLTGPFCQQLAHPNLQ